MKTKTTTSDENACTRTNNNRQDDRALLYLYEGGRGKRT